jgi:hypothetical protein
MRRNLKRNINMMRKNVEFTVGVNFLFCTVPRRSKISAVILFISERPVADINVF